MWEKNDNRDVFSFARFALHPILLVSSLGSKLPDPACYGHTQFHLVPDRYHRDRMALHQQSDQVELFLRANGLASLFAWTGAQAMYQGELSIHKRDSSRAYDTVYIHWYIYLWYSSLIFFPCAESRNSALSYMYLHICFHPPHVTPSLLGQVIVSI